MSCVQVSYWIIHYTQHVMLHHCVLCNSNNAQLEGLEIDQYILEILRTLNE